MADASADVADTVDHARERLEQAITRLEAAFVGAAEKSVRDGREVDVLKAENAELREARASQASRNLAVAERLDEAIERLRATIEKQP